MRVLYIFWIQSFIRCIICKLFHPFYWGCFSLSWCCPISVNDPFLVNICTWCEAEVQLHLMWISGYLVNIYWKGSSFSFELSCHLFQKLIDHKCKGLFLDSLVQCMDLYVMYILLQTQHRFDYCSFVVSFEIGKCESSNFVLFFKIILPILGPLPFHINFRSPCKFL